MFSKHPTIAIALIGTVTFSGIAPAIAAPVLSSTVLVKNTAPDMIDQVRVRGRRGSAIGAGIALGVLGALAGAAVQNRYYYSGSGYYGPTYYGPGYYGGYRGPGYYQPYSAYPYPYGAYPYPYGYNYGYNYYPRSGAVAAGAAIGAIGAIIGTAARNPQRYRWGWYQYHDPHAPW